MFFIKRAIENRQSRCAARFPRVSVGEARFADSESKRDDERKRSAIKKTAK